MFHNFPANEDLLTVSGAHLSQVSFGVGNISLDFGFSKSKVTGGSAFAKVVAMSPLKLFLADDIFDIQIGNFSEISRLGTLLNLDIVSAVNAGKSAVQLDFGAGRLILLKDNAEGFESYHWYLPDQVNAIKE